ncbi:hypothetical protein JF540_23355 [Salipiger thiooxidans]|uniref:amidase family protein n=1 Tax=Salipiger thiooxidans TaxID=282683 RepID=UPI001A8F5BC7|nr:hypothetical protein [Salipiger thiooxidans]
MFSLKSSYGRLSRAGSFSFVDSLDHLGPLARSVTDLALVYDAMQGLARTTTAAPTARSSRRLSHHQFRKRRLPSRQATPPRGGVRPRHERPFPCGRPRGEMRFATTDTAQLSSRQCLPVAKRSPAATGPCGPIGIDGRPRAMLPIKVKRHSWNPL